MERQRTTLLDAYVRKAIALGKTDVIESTKTESYSRVAVLSEMDQIYLEIGKFIDYYDPKVIGGMFTFLLHRFHL